MYARIRYLWICLILITILTGCAEPSSAASTPIATVSRPESSSPTDTPSPSAAAIVWPEEDYAALGEEGKAAYREALAEQLPADGYLILEDGFVVENDSAGRYAPADFAALLPDVTLPAQAVGGYALNEIQVSWQPDPLARPGDRVLRRYRLAADNLQGAALTYADADGHTVRVNLIGLAALGGAPDADAEIRWSAEPVLRAEEAGQTVYGLDGTLRQPGGQAIIQLHAAAEDETAFLAAVAAFTEVTGWMVSTL